MIDEFRVGLELATTEELYGLTTLLFKRRFNPLDYLWSAAPAQVQCSNHKLWLDQLEKRFRFLAADGVTVIRRQAQDLPYHHILIQVCHYLKIDYSHDWSVIELEETIFLHLLDVAYQCLPACEQQTLEHHFQQELSQWLPSQPFFSPIQPTSLRLVLEGGSALVVQSWIKPWLLHYAANRVAVHIARYQLTRQVLMSGGRAVGAIQNRVAMNMARQGAALSLVRYSTARSILSMIGPMMWTWFLADLGWRAIATNYSRVIPAIFTVAQIRLLRTDTLSLHSWSDAG